MAQEAATPEQWEAERKSQLDLRRNQAPLRAEPQNNRPNPQQEASGLQQPNEHKHKSRLARLKAGAHLLGQKNLSARAGSIAGGWAGGTIGSILPLVGTAAGAFLGRFLGKKLGVTGIAIISLLALSLTAFALFILFMIAIKGYCDHITAIGRAIESITIGACKSVQKL